MGNTHSEGHDFKICTAQCQHPLKFQYQFDKAAHISPNQLIFRKFAQGRATMVGERPLMKNEIICLKITMFHKGTLKFGITPINPDNMTIYEFEGLILNNPNALILRLLSKKCVQKGNILFFQYTPEGEIMFGWSKKGKIKEKATLITGLQVGTPLWAVFEVFGKNITFRLENELIPLLASMPAEMMKARNIEMIHQSLESIPSEVGRKREESMRKTMSCNKLDQQESSNASEETSSHPRSPHFDTITDFSEFFKLPISTIEEMPYNKHNPSPPTHHNMPTTSTSIRSPKTLSKYPLHFHTTTGKNVSLSYDEFSARRTTGSYNAYVFTSRPISTDESISILLNTVDSTMKKGLGFGLTVCDPDSINDFPDDGYDLLDRGEYWVYVKDVLKNVSEREEVSFFLSRRGKVGMSRGGEEKTLVHVDTSLPLWIFFDLTGCIQHISSLGASKRQSLKKEPNFRSDRNFQRQSERISIPVGQNFANPSPISSSVHIAEPINLNKSSRRNSENCLSPHISPKNTHNTYKNSNILSQNTPLIPENFHCLPPNTPPPIPTSTRPSNYHSIKLPTSLVAPLIPLPSRPQPNHPTLNPPIPPKHPTSNPLSSHPKSQNLSENQNHPSNHPTNIPTESTSKEAVNENFSNNKNIGNNNNNTSNCNNNNTINDNITDNNSNNNNKNNNITDNNNNNNNKNNNNITDNSNNNNQACSIGTYQPTKTISPLQQHDIEQLLQQIDSLKRPTEPNQPECSICLDLPPDCVLYTCGHMCLCHACATGVLNSQTPFCPICRKEIKDIVKIYRS